MLSPQINLTPAEHAAATERLQLILFDTPSGYLVSWHVITIGNGTLPCILVENFWRRPESWLQAP